MPRAPRRMTRVTSVAAVAVRALMMASLFAGLALVTSACRPGYIARVGVEHLRFMSRAEPIVDLIEDEADPDRRRRLELVLAARVFAKANGLDVGGSYAKVSDTSGLSTAYVVTAAYADRLEPYQWSYPIVGRVPYRGYFEREHADAFGERLAADGYDVYVVEAGAYSTLGWFDDPLPSGVLDYDDVALVDLVLHELVHRTVYVPGDIAFNETLASAVAGRLTIRFFEQRGADDEARIARERRERWLAQGRLLDALAHDLTAYFERARGREAGAMLAGRREIYAAALAPMAEVGLVPAQPAPDLVERFNNAVFLSLWRYRRRADVIDAYLAGAGAGAEGEALRALPEIVDGADDPYRAIDASTAAGPCCSDRLAVFSLDVTWRSHPSRDPTRLQ